MVANKVPSRVNDSVHSFVEHCRTCSWNRWKIVNSNYTSVHSGNKVHIWVGPRTRPSQNFSTTLWLVHSSLHTIYTHAHVEIETLTSTDAQQAAGIFFRIQQGARKLLQAWFRGTAAPLLNWTIIAVTSHTLQTHTKTSRHTLYHYVLGPPTHASGQARPAVAMRNTPWKQAEMNTVKSFFISSHCTPLL